MAALCMAINIAPVLAAGRFEDGVSKSVESIQNNVDLDYQNTGSAELGWGIRDFIIYLVQKIITPIVIFVGILLGILGLYELLGSTKEDAQKKWFNYILRWALWIIVIISANFLANTLVNGWIFVYDAQRQLVGTLSAQRIYQRLMFPFLKFFMYLAIGILFILALIRTVGMLMDSKPDSSKQAKTIILRNAIWILVIIFAKQIIEVVYGREQDVVSATATNLWQIGTGVLTDKQLPFVYTVINYIISFVGFFLLIMIVIQAVQLLMNPTDEATQKKMRTNFIYILIWLVIMWTAYVVTNFLIVK